MHRYLALFCLALAATAQNQPTFRAGTRLVEVDVIARSKGAPAAGLTKEDFTLLDNGNPQNIAFFSVSSARTPRPPAGPAAAPLPPGAVSNRLQRGGEAAAHATVLLVDQRNTPQAVQGFAIQRVVKFVQMRRMGDRIGIYTFLRDGSLHAVPELTDDSEVLSRSVSNLKPRAPNFQSPQGAGAGAATIEIVKRVMDTKHVFEAVARHLASVPGRKTLIWMSTGFPLVVPGLGLDFRRDMEEAAHALNDANVALYGVDARGMKEEVNSLTNAQSGGPRRTPQVLLLGRGNPDPQDFRTMTMLADRTGGLVFYNNSNALEESIQTAIDDGELTYTLGFYPLEEARDGVWHKLKVEVKRRGVSVRHRENYFASRAVEPANAHLTLEELLRDSLDATQLELLAEATSDPSGPGRFRVRVSIDLHNVQLQMQNNTWRGAIDVSLFSEESKTARTITWPIEIPDDQLAAALDKGIEVNDSVEIEGETGELRIVVQDRATGAAGSVRVRLRRK